MVCLQKLEDNFWESVFSFHDVGSRDWTEVIRHGSKMHLLMEYQVLTPGGWAGQSKYTCSNSVT